MNELFESKDRSYLGPANHNENTYDYYCRSGRQGVSIMRQTLNSWFLDYPDHGKMELKKRFEKTFSSAFFELFIHELFIRQGFEIEIHPKLNDSNRKPDFLIKKDGIEVYIEAKETKDKTREEEALERRINQFYDSFNTINSPKFFIYVKELLFKSSQQPQTKNLIKKLEDKIQLFEPEEILKQIQKSGFENESELKYEDDDITIIISLIPKSEKAQFTEGLRPIAMFPMVTEIGGSEESIKNSFIKKAKKYKTLNKPYIICINAIGIKGDISFDIENAIWGSLILTWSTDPNNRNEHYTRKKDGFFYGNQGPQFKNVSGVLVTKVMEFNIPLAPFWFVKHPFSEKEIDFENFDLTYYYVSKNQIQKVDKSDFGEILKINDNWIDPMT
jgi:hypothetical protein